MKIIINKYHSICADYTTKEMTDTTTLGGLDINVPVKQTIHNTFGGHTESIYSVDISPDGKYLATGSSDQSAILRDMKTRRILWVFNGHSKAVRAIKFSPDGRYLITGSDDKTAVLVDVRTGKKVKDFESDKAVNFVDFYLDGKCLVEDSIRDIKTGEKLIQFAGNIKAVSPDCRFVATEVKNDTLIIYDTLTGKRFQIIENDKIAIRSATFSKDGQYLVLEYGNNTLVLWEVKSGNQLKKFEGNARSFMYSYVEFSPNNKWILTSGEEGETALLEIKTGKCRKRYKEPGHTVSHALFSPDGDHVVTVGYDKSAILWDAHSGERLKKFEGQTESINSLSVSSDNKYLLIGSYNGKAILWDIKECKRIKVYEKRWSPIFSPNGKYILSCVRSLVPFPYGEIGPRPDLWDVILCEVKTGRTIRRFKTCYYLDAYATFSPDGKSLLTGSYKTATIWDIITGRHIKSFNLPKDKLNAVRSVAYSPDGECIATGLHDGSVIVWEVNTGKQKNTIKLEHLDVRAIAFNTDGKSILVCDNEIAILFDLESGQLLKKFIGHSGYILSAVFSPNGQYILTGSADNKIILWEVKSGKKIKIINKISGQVLSVMFSQDGSYLVFAGEGLEVCLWDMMKQEIVASFYSLNEGFLWTTPPDRGVPSGWFWTDRPELISVLKCNMDGSEPQALEDDDPERIAYINAHNRRDLVLSRLNDHKAYQEELNQMIGQMNYKQHLSQIIRQCDQLRIGYRH